MVIPEQDLYRDLLSEVDSSIRRLAADAGPREDEQVRRDAAIVELSKLGVPRSVVAKLTRLTRGRVQQILDRAGESGATGEVWDGDQRLRRMVEYAILELPIPSIGVGLRRESVSGPHVGAGWGGQIRLTDDLERNRADVVEALEKLIDHARAGDFDKLLVLSPEEVDIVRGRPLASS